MTFGDRYSTGSGTRQELLAAYDLWSADEQRLEMRDAEGGEDTPSDDEWSRLWVAGKELLHEFASRHRETDECGHGSAAVMADGEVVCPDCPAVWLPEVGA